MTLFQVEGDHLKIDDNYRTNIWLVYIIAVASVVSIATQLATKQVGYLGLLDSIMMATGLLLVIACIWFDYTKSTKSEFLLKDNKKLHVFDLLGSYRYSLHLKNGKKRDLMITENQAKCLSDLLQSEK
jgi:hypothetical protein